jgi:hypothetical protein
MRWTTELCIRSILYQALVTVNTYEALDLYLYDYSLNA